MEARMHGRSLTVAPSGRRAAFLVAWLASASCGLPVENDPRFWDERATRAAERPDGDPGSGGGEPDAMDEGGAGGGAPARGGSGGPAAGGESGGEGGQGGG